MKERRQQSRGGGEERMDREVNHSTRRQAPSAPPLRQRLLPLLTVTPRRSAPLHSSSLVTIQKLPYLPSSSLFHLPALLLPPPSISSHLPFSSSFVHLPFSPPVSLSCSSNIVNLPLCLSSSSAPHPHAAVLPCLPSLIRTAPPHSSLRPLPCPRPHSHPLLACQAQHSEGVECPCPSTWHDAKVSAVETRCQNWGCGDAPAVACQSLHLLRCPRRLPVALRSAADADLPSEGVAPSHSTALEHSGGGVQRVAAARSCRLGRHGSEAGGPLQPQDRPLDGGAEGHLHTAASTGQ